MYCAPIQDFSETFYSPSEFASCAQMVKNAAAITDSYPAFESFQENSDIFGLQFAANQLFKLVSNAEELFQRLVSSELLPKCEQEQISHWLMLKQECEDCLSENSEPHRSLERIEEEIEDDDDEDSPESFATSDSDDDDDEKTDEIAEKVHTFMDAFRTATNHLVSKANAPYCAPKTSTSASNEFYMKGARGRRGSIHSADELRPTFPNHSKSGEFSDNLEKSALVNDTKKKHLKTNLKKIVAALELNQKKIDDLEATIRDKERYMNQLREHKATRSLAQGKIEQKCQLLREEYSHARHSEVKALEKKLQNYEDLKNYITDGGHKLLELEKSLQVSNKNLGKLKRYKQEMEEYRAGCEGQIGEENERIRVLKSGGSSTKSADNKIVALLHSNDTLTSNLSLSNEELACLLHEIRNLRQTRDFIHKKLREINVKVRNKQLLTDVEQRELFQCEEAVEAIDLIIEYKNLTICGHQAFHDKVLEEQGDKMLMERFLKLNETEMRILLHKYFNKIVDLRASSKGLEVEILQIEAQHDKLVGQVQKLSETLQLVRSDAERQIVSMQQQHEDKLFLVLQNLASDGGAEGIAGGSKRVTLVASGSKHQVDKNSFIARVRYKGTVQQRAPAVAYPGGSQAKVTIEKTKNKLFMQKK